MPEGLTGGERQVVFLLPGLCLRQIKILLFFFQKVKEIRGHRDRQLKKNLERFGGPYLYRPKTDGTLERFGITIKKADGTTYYTTGPGTISGRDLKIQLQKNK